MSMNARSGEAGQNIRPASESGQMRTEDGFELPAVAESELAQQRSYRRRCVDGSE